MKNPEFDIKALSVNFKKGAALWSYVAGDRKMLKTIAKIRKTT